MVLLSQGAAGVVQSQLCAQDYKIRYFAYHWLYIYRFCRLFPALQLLPQQCVWQVLSHQHHCPLLLKLVYATEVCAQATGRDIYPRVLPLRNQVHSWISVRVRVRDYCVYFSL